MSKKLVATDKAIDPAMVTAEDLVRAINNETVGQLAERLGWKAWDNWPNLSDLCDATSYIANLITLPTDKPTQRTWDRGTGYDHQSNGNGASLRQMILLSVDDHQSNGNGASLRQMILLSVDDPINGVEQ